MNNLPIPSLQYFPQIYQDNPSANITAMSNKIDSILTGISNDINKLSWIYNVDKCPQLLLPELSYLLNAGVLIADSDTVVRQKIYYAIENHIKRFSWENRVKAIIDAITSLNAVMYQSTNEDDWILTGNGIVETGTEWAILGGDGTSPYGMLLLGSGTEVEVAGNIFINAHYGVFTAVLSPAQLTAIVAALNFDIVPAYMIINIGYEDSGGVFQIYATIGV